MFIELMPMLKERTVLITVALIEGKLKVNVIPTKAKDSEDQALTTPLSYTGSPEELDAELGKHLASYVGFTCATREHPGRSEGGNGCGGEGRSSKSEGNSADPEV